MGSIKFIHTLLLWESGGDVPWVCLWHRRSQRFKKRSETKNDWRFFFSILLGNLDSENSIICMSL